MLPFEPSKSRLFDDAVSNMVFPDVVVPTKSSKLLFDEPKKTITEIKHSAALFFGEDTYKTRVAPAPKAVTPILENSVYRDNPLLKGKNEKFIEMVVQIDQVTHLDSAMNIITFGETIQSNIARLMENASAASSAMAAVGILERMDAIRQTLERLSPDKFTGVKRGGLFSRNVPYTVKDYIEEFKNADIEVSKKFNELKSNAITILDIVNNSDQFMINHEIQVEWLDAHVIAGKLIAERNSKKIFAAHNEQMLIAQFEKRLIDLATYENLCVISFEQMKLVQQNLITMASTAQSMANMIYPLWKSSFSTMISKWQSNSNVKLNSPISDLMHDDMFKEATEKNSQLVLTITQQKGT